MQTNCISVLNLGRRHNCTAISVINPSLAELRFVWIVSNDHDQNC